VQCELTGLGRNFPPVHELGSCFSWIVKRAQHAVVRCEETKVGTG